MANSVTLRPARTAPRFKRVVGQTLRRLVKDLFDPYHPERHYMRGPGPKWNAKHTAGSKA